MSDKLAIAPLPFAADDGGAAVTQFHRIPIAFLGARR